MKSRFMFALAIFLFASVAAKSEFLWKVESAKATIYLLGSIHVGNQNMYPLAPKVDEAFLSCDSLGVEINPKNIDPGEIIRIGMLPAGRTLDKVLPDSTFQKYKFYFEKHKVPEMAYKSFKPWYAALMISNLEMSESGLSAEYGVDIHYMKLSDSLKKGIIELESLTSQMKLLTDFDSIPDEFLNLQLDKSGEAKNAIDSLVIAWKIGDDNAILKLLNEQEDKDPKVRRLWDNLIEKRNITMTNKITDYLGTNKKYFVIVGSAHLLGENGVVSRLRAKKFKVTRIY